MPLALNGVLLGKCLLNGVKISSPAKALHGKDFPAIQLGSQHEASVDGATINHDGARSALADPAPFFCSF